MIDVQRFAKIGENGLFRSVVQFVFVCAILSNREGGFSCFNENDNNNENFYF